LHFLSIIFSKDFIRTELIVIGRKLLIDGFFLKFLINKIILPTKWMLFGPSSICYLKYLNNCVSPFFVEASYYTTPIGSLSHDNPFGETS